MDVRDKIRNPFLNKLSDNTGDASFSEDTLSETSKASFKNEQGPNTHFDTSLPMSVIACFVGMLAGTLPATIWTLIFRFSFIPLYALLPIAVYCSIKLFRGRMGRQGLILTIIFSLLGAYLTAASCQAALFVVQYKMLFLNIPLVAIAMLGRAESLPGSVLSAATLFPVIFSLLGILWTSIPLLNTAEPYPASEAKLSGEDE